MKLLFDQNISPRILRFLKSGFEGSTQVRFAGLEDASDPEIFQFARQNGYIIVTFDSDFADLSAIHGAPPKVIWLRAGNQTTLAISELLRKNTDAMRAFVEVDEQDILLISDLP